ncbi:MAG: WG repeat-containing protein, partial [bacterium]
MNLRMLTAMLIVFMVFLCGFASSDMPANENNNNLFYVCVDGKYGFIDKTGKIVINPQFDETWHFSEDLAPVIIGDIESGKWGFIDKTGKFVINPQFDWARDFLDGLAWARIGGEGFLGTGKWGVIDKTG